MSEIFGDENKTFARVERDSIDRHGNRLTTMVVQCHRFVLAEFNTHRAFSRNSASSRAIPFPKMVDRVQANPAFPLSFPAEQKGMQGGEELDDEDIARARGLWLLACQGAVDSARAMHALGVHKSVCNRLLEPFMYHTIIVSATEWSNFFQQRCSPLAQPEIREVAEYMQVALLDSTPTPIDDSEWHTPFIQPDEESLPVRVRVQASAARCARVSYLTHDGVLDIQKDMELFNRLVTADPPHWSPLEHVAQGGYTPPVAGNFRGFRQYRHFLAAGFGLD